MRNQRLARLFEKFRSHGRTEALALVFDATAPALLRVARRVVRNAADADDAVQATFVAAIECRASWDRSRPLEPWLFGILLRQIGRQRRSDARVVDPGLVATPAPAEEPRTQVERAELVASVEAALRGLPELDREVLLPWLHEEARGGELARRLGVEGSTLRMRLHRGLARLRRALPAGLATAIVLSAAERQTLAATRRKVIEAASRPRVAVGGAVASGAGVAAKLAAGLLAAAATIAGVVLARPWSASESERLAPRVAGGTDGGSRATSDFAAPTSASRVAARRTLDERASAGDAAGAIAQDEVATVLTKGVVPSPASWEVAGLVETSARAPVANAVVRVFEDDAFDHGSIAETRTAADGTFRLALPVEPLRFVAWSEEFGQVVEQAAPGGSALTLTLKEGATIEGVVTREDGSTVASARVVCADDGTRFGCPHVALTDGAGRYTLRHVRGRVRWISATTVQDGSPVPPLLGFTTLDPAVAGSSASPDVVLHATDELVVTVASRDDGRPIADALVVALAGSDALDAAGLDVRGDGLLDPLEPWSVVARSDVAGEVRFRGVPTQRPLTLALAAPGCAPTATLLAAAARAMRIELDPACAIEGLVRTLDGAPVPDARVVLEELSPARWLRLPPGTIEPLRALALEEGRGNPFALATTTRADGTFRLADLPPLTGRCLRVTTKRATAFEWIDALAPGDVRRDVTITLGRKVRIEGTITGEDGPLPAGAQIWLDPASELATVSPDGRFVLEARPHGAATLRAVASGYVHARCDLAAPLEDVNVVQITMRRGESIEGRVLDGSGQPLSGARVIAWPADPTVEERERVGGWITEKNLASTTSRSDGRFVLDGLPSRPLRVVASANGFVTATLEPVARDGRDVTLQLVQQR